MLHVICRLTHFAAAAQLKEIKNGRLAMLAFGGIFHQQLLTKTGSLAFLANPKVQF
jgi:hypothetical protein